MRLVLEGVFNIQVLLFAHAGVVETFQIALERRKRKGLLGGKKEIWKQTDPYFALIGHDGQRVVLDEELKRNNNIDELAGFKSGAWKKSLAIRNCSNHAELRLRLATWICSGLFRSRPWWSRARWGFLFRLFSLPSLSSSFAENRRYMLRGSPGFLGGSFLDLTARIAIFRFSQISCRNFSCFCLASLEREIVDTFWANSLAFQTNSWCSYASSTPLW